MSQTDAGVKYGPVPLLIGVTGHRNLRHEDTVELEKRVSTILQEYRTKYPYTPLVVLSPLADGADRLVARVALRLGLSLHVPLPMPRSIYLTDFADASRQEFEQLEKQAEQVFELPLLDGNRDEDIRQHGAARNKQYDAVGDYIARHCQALIALWDGEPSEKIGGTADIVRWRLTELPLAASSRLHPPDPVLSGPVIQVVTPREGRESPKAPLTIVKHYPKVLQHDAVPESTYVKIFERIDKFNRDVTQQTDPAALQQSREYLFPEAKAQQLPRALQRTRDCFAAADVLAVQNQRQSFWSLKWILALVFAAVVTYEVLEQVLQIFAWAMLSYPIVLGVAYATYYWAHWHDYQNKYQDYRALAEGLRVQFFWRLAGLKDSVEANYLRKQRVEMYWIRTAVRVLWGLQGGQYEASASPVSPGQQAERLQLVLQHWIDDQHSFFSRRAETENHKHERFEKLVHIGMVVGLLLSLGIGLLFATPNPISHATHEWFEKSHWAEGILIVLTSLPLLGAMVIHTYVEYRALSQQARQYRAMELLFANARHQWQVLTQNPAADASVADMLGLIEELGKEALVENADWVLLHRDRPLEVPHGK